MAPLLRTLLRVSAATLNEFTFKSEPSNLSLQDILCPLPELKSLCILKHSINDFIDFFPKLQTLDFCLSADEDDTPLP
jgi:hypothetical protein